MRSAYSHFDELAEASLQEQCDLGRRPAEVRSTRARADPSARPELDREARSVLVEP